MLTAVMWGIRAGVKKRLDEMGYDVRQRTLVEVPRLTSHQAARLLYFHRLFDLVADIPGDVVECGIGYGRSFLMLAYLVHDEMKGRKLWGFDSFSGFPEPSKHDASVRRLKRGEWSGAEIDSIVDLLMMGGLDRAFIDSQTTIVKGFFDQSLAKYRGQSIALLHLDVDLYDSYRTTLEQLYPKVPTGGVVCFDEYMGTGEHAKYPGAQRAIDEYFGDDVQRIARDKVTGKYYIVKQ